ncbi:hypothetical protein QVZ41_08725 [Wenyingzhuangia sp. chi5]|uniref:Uncharacterized protein n=1 Tax=Wenyingzhuangia gilva TaxID=3057677 RepID=A0ABT8VSH8_9FLAO|nr:hypothetical protein [Wenyingzhuangia sp. chi5]MDO3694925.1 hypothetical protein [Wenyingzhuangia sp. chi5]
MVTQNNLKTTNQQLSLGSIGITNGHVFKKEFKTTAFPSYKNPIKITARLLPFGKKTSKNYVTAKETQLHQTNLLSVDSLEVPQHYVIFTLTDKVSLVNSLNTSENQNVKDYLIHHTSANMLTQVAMAFNNKTLETLQKAEAIFLIESSYKTYALQLYQQGQKTARISLSEGIVFGYETATFCWQENNRHQLDLIDIVSSKNGCEQKVHPQKKEKDVFDF